MPVTTREHFCLFLVGMDLQGDLDAFLLGGGLEHAADGGGREAIATDEHGDVLLGEDELEPQLLGTKFGHLELRLGRVVDEIDGHVLEEILQTIGDGLHGVQKMQALRALRKPRLRLSTVLNLPLEPCTTILPPMSIAELRLLPADEKLRIIETLWSDLSGQDEDIASPAWHDEELRKTEAAFLAGSEEIHDWTEAKKVLRAKFE